MVSLGDIVAIMGYDRDIIGVITEELPLDSWRVSWLNGGTSDYSAHDIYWLKEHWTNLTTGRIESRL